MSTSLPGVVVDIEISLPDGRHHRISEIGDRPANVNLVSEAARETNTSFDYSGRHDNGLLPSLKTEGALGLLVTAVQKAKAECDAYLTAIIDEEYRALGASAQASLKEEVAGGGVGGGGDDIDEEDDDNDNNDNNDNNNGAEENGTKKLKV